MHKIAHDLQELEVTYKQSIQQQQQFTILTDPLINNLETRDYFFTILEKEMEGMIRMLNNGRINNLIDKQNSNPNTKTSLRYGELAKAVDMKRSYDPPGELSKDGKRHDNDFVEISEISIIPTVEEILCEHAPFLPSSLPDAPHFSSDGSAKLLDTQFRLLREDMLNPIRDNISNLITVLSRHWNSSSFNNNKEFSKELKRIQNEYGGLQIYNNIEFFDITCDSRRGFAYTLRFSPPKIRGARNERDRMAYWKKSKRLLNGSLITLLLPNSDSKRKNPNFTNDNNNSSNNTPFKNNSDMFSVYFGVVVLRNEEFLGKNADSAYINVSFNDSSIYPIALNEILKSHNKNNNMTTEQSIEKRFLVESTGVYLESYYHILKTLQTTDPSSLPFEKYFFLIFIFQVINYL